MGLVVHDDARKVISAEGREWGPESNGLALSIRLEPNSDREAQPEITAVIINRGAKPATLRVPGWLFYFSYEVTDAKGAPVPLSSFGGQLLRPERRTDEEAIVLAPGQHAATEIPIGAIYGLSPDAAYQIRVRAGALESNQILAAKTAM